jgi:hypothetical protein
MSIKDSNANDILSQAEIEIEPFTINKSIDVSRDNSKPPSSVRKERQDRRSSKFLSLEILNGDISKM